MLPCNTRANESNSFTKEISNFNLYIVGFRENIEMDSAILLFTVEM